MNKLTKVGLIVKYCDQICQAIEEDGELFQKRIDLIMVGGYGTQEFEQIEHQLKKVERKIKNLAEQATKIT